MVVIREPVLFCDRVLTAQFFVCHVAFWPNATFLIFPFASTQKEMELFLEKVRIILNCTRNQEMPIILSNFKTTAKIDKGSKK